MDKIITIDGPSASGKSTVSRLLAEELRWPWVSTGIFYRGLAFTLIEKNVDLDTESEILPWVDDPCWQVRMTGESTLAFFGKNEVTDRVQGEQIGSVASKISQFSGVRKALLDRQRRCYDEKSGLIAEGRDCGTVVFPEAFLKVYLTADAKSRAQRRSIDENTNWQDTLELQRKRDRDDSHRKQAPMKVAEGALEIDSSHRGLAEVVKMIGLEARQRLGQISF